MNAITISVIANGYLVNLPQQIKVLNPMEQFKQQIDYVAQKNNEMQNTDPVLQQIYEENEKKGEQYQPPQQEDNSILLPKIPNVHYCTTWEDLCAFLSSIGERVKPIEVKMGTHVPLKT